MGKETDNLIALANAVSTTQPGREMDMLLTVGERKSMALLCMALADLGRRGRQLHRQPGRHHHRQRPRPRPRSSRSRATACGRRSPQGKVCVVAGFQGVSTGQGDHHARPGRVRHHGGGPGRRVQGRQLRDLHRRDRRVPRRPPHRAAAPASCPGCRFDEMLEMAATGGRVLALRSVEFARNHDVPLHVRSSFTWEPGTWVTEEEPRHGGSDHLGRHPRRLARPRSRHRRARPARHRRAAVPGRWPTPASTST